MSYFATLPPPAEVLQPQVQAQQTQVAQQPQISDRRYGVKLKIAAFVAIAYIVLSSHTFLKVMNAIVCGICAAYGRHQSLASTSSGAARQKG